MGKLLYFFFFLCLWVKRFSPVSVMDLVLRCVRFPLPGDWVVMLSESGMRGTGEESGAARSSSNSQPRPGSRQRRAAGAQGRERANYRHFCPCPRCLPRAMRCPWHGLVGGCLAVRLLGGVFLQRKLGGLSSKTQLAAVGNGGGKVGHVCNLRQQVVHMSSLTPLLSTARIRQGGASRLSGEKRLRAGGQPWPPCKGVATGRGASPRAGATGLGALALARSRPWAPAARRCRHCPAGAGCSSSSGPRLFPMCTCRLRGWRHGRPAPGGRGRGGSRVDLSHKHFGTSLRFFGRLPMKS